MGELHGKTVANHPCLQYWGKQGYIRVRAQVPRDRIKIMGTHQLVRSLKTTCVSEAVRRSHAVLAEFQAMIEAARPVPIVRALIMPPGMSDMPMTEQAAMILTYTQARQRGVEFPGNAGTPWVLPFYADVPQAPVEPVETPLAGYTYEAALQLWVTSKGNEPPAPESVKVYRGHLRRLFKRLGHDEMGRVTEQDILDQPVVLMTGSDGERKCSNVTINHHMESIRSVFRVAKRERKITTDPTWNTIHKLPVGETSRKEFGRKQYPALVQAANSAEDEAVRWLWLLGLTLGCRIGEPADALASAVYQEDEESRWVLNISLAHRRIGPNGKPIPLKTKGSKRILPLHSFLIAAGFLDYVERVKREHGEHAPLFPNFQPNENGKFSDAASELCNAWLRDDFGITDPSLTFHSTRHSTRTFLRRLDVPEDLADKITGHGGKKAVGRTYGAAEISAMSAVLEAYMPVVAVA